MNQMITNRKTATRLLLVQWSRFQNVCIKLEGSTLITGVNGSGKSTVLDAMTYVLTGNTQFNKAAKDRDRTVKAYVRGDTKSNGADRYLRKDDVVSYIVMEFWSPSENQYIVIGVCIESQDEVSSPSSNWFIMGDARLEDFNFTVTEGRKLIVTPKSGLKFKGNKIKSAEFYGRDKARDQILRRLGLRYDAEKYRQKLLKMMAFNPENNIDQFISECVLEPGKINSLKELREQREKFDTIKQSYDNLIDGKAQLEKIEQKTREYEEKLRNISIRELMAVYQELQFSRKELENIEKDIKNFTQKEQELKEKHVLSEKELERASERYHAARSSEVFQSMEKNMQIISNEIEEHEKNIDIFRNRVQELMYLGELLGRELKWFFEDFKDGGQGEALLHLHESSYDMEAKRTQLIAFLDRVETLKEQYQRDKIHKEDEISALENEIALLEEKIKKLAANIMIYPEDVAEAKEIINREFRKQNIKGEVRFFAELVNEIKDISWRASIETSLGRKRYYLITEPENCHKALEILQNKRIHTATVILTDKLPETETTKESAADQLVISNIYARRYANYVLNGIHLCETLEELEEYPLGGLMRNGMLAKSYGVTYMNIRKTKVCLGQNVIELQKKATEEERDEKVLLYKDAKNSLIEIKERLRSLKSVNTDASAYRLDAPEMLEESIKKKSLRESELKEIRNSPGFLAATQEMQKAETAYNEARYFNDNIVKDIGITAEKLQRRIKQKAFKQEDIKEREYDYSEKRKTNLELEKPMMEEYQKQSRRRGEVRVITEKYIQSLRSELEKVKYDMEDLQLEYCRIAEIDINRRGPAFIQFYRSEYSNVANAKIEEVRVKLDEQSEKLESAFMNDFVAEMNETIVEAKKEIALINRELKQIPFGQDTYRFRMDEKPDRALFFRITRKLDDYMGSPEVYMNMSRDDEEMERDIQEFMSMILEEENEEEYTDYRKYFTYDMDISSSVGDRQTTSALSKKQGSASNGEKQTPYFIILAASLLQCYPKELCCQRLAFIDEAFSALSRERIEKMVQYFEDNNFQVIYAAPPEKIGSIGQYIHSTVSLVSTGRFTSAVEGLVKTDGAQ